MDQDQGTGPSIANLGLHLEAKSLPPPPPGEDFARPCLVRGAAHNNLAGAASSHLPTEIAGLYRRMEAIGP